jgi:YidC/Oxa1 family membrane protein insertase
MDTQRLILLFVFGFSVLMLWEAWERDHRPKPAPVAQQPTVQPAVPAPASTKPGAPVAPGAPASQAVAPAAAP